MTSGKRVAGNLIPLSLPERVNAALACLLTVAMAIHLAHAAIAQHRFFDDSLMFYRYAIHFRQTDVIAWDPGGPPVFGLTSLPWLLPIWLGTFLTRDPVLLVVALSSAVGLLTFFVAARLISRRSRSRLLSHASVVFPLVGLPLLMDAHFSMSLASGMETMFGLLASFLFAIGILRFIDRPRANSSAILLALAAVLAVLIRPEMILCASLMPLLAWLFFARGSSSPRTLVLYGALLIAFLGVTLALNAWYFHSALPLSFYIKAVHGYEGYLLFLNPVAYTTYFFEMCLFPLLTVTLFADKQDLPLLAVFSIPLGLTFAYLLTVLQIMGLSGRYYVPFVPFLIVPAACVADRVLLHWENRPALSPRRLLAVGVVVLFSAQQYSERLSGSTGTVIASSRSVYARPVFQTGGDLTLPELGGVWDVCFPVAQIARALPPGGTIAASEVGLLGALAPQANIIDLAGLNDAQIARSGFSMQYVLSRKPEILWFPHSDYTRLYGLFASDPRLLEQYVVYAGAFNFGIALRKDLSPESPTVQAFYRVWADTYPGVDSSRFIVQHVAWNPHLVPRATRAVIVAHP